MLKILISLFPFSQQKGLAVCIRFLELQYTLSHQSLQDSGISSVSDRIPIDLNSGNNEAVLTLLDELLPFCSTSEYQRVLQMKEMLINFSRMKEMMEMLQMMKEFFPEGFGADNCSESTNPSDILSFLGGLSGMNFSDWNFNELGDLINLFGKDNNNDRKQTGVDE